MVVLDDIALAFKIAGEVLADGGRAALMDVRVDLGGGEVSVWITSRGEVN